MSRPHWTSLPQRKFEDRLLAQYWSATGGLVIGEVPVGGSGSDPWPGGSKTRRIDGVRIPQDATEKSGLVNWGSLEPGQFEEIVTDAPVEVVEVKKKLNRPVIGQALVGAEMFQLQYSPATVQTVIVFTIQDPALKLICERFEIEIWRARIR